MNILVLSQMYPNPANPINGIFVHEQAKALAKQGCNIKIISPIPWVPPLIGWMKSEWTLYAKTPSMIYRDGIQVFYPRYVILPNNIGLEFYGWTYYIAIKGIAQMLYDRWPFDIIHAHVVLPDGHGAMLLNRRYNKPLVVTIHGQDMYYTVHRNRLSEKRIIEVLNSTDTVVSVSSPLSRAISRYVNDVQKIVTISNGIAMEDICEWPSDLKEKYRGKKVLLSVANLIKTKGHDNVLLALKSIIEQYPNVVYVIVGDGEYKKNLEAMVKELGLEHYVEFVGQLSHKEAMEYMSICDVFVLPSWQEAFGIAYIEAMAHGKPVIACHGTGIADIIADGQNGLLVRPQDVPSLVEAILKLLNNPDYAHRIGCCAKSMAVENFTWENNARKMKNIYQRLKKAKNGA